MKLFFVFIFFLEHSGIGIKGELGGKRGVCWLGEGFCYSLRTRYGVCSGVVEMWGDLASCNLRELLVIYWMIQIEFKWERLCVWGSCRLCYLVHLFLSKYFLSTYYMPGDVIGPRGNMLCLCVAHILQKRQWVKCIVCYIVIIAKEKNSLEEG